MKMKLTLTLLAALCLVGHAANISPVLSTNVGGTLLNKSNITVLGHVTAGSNVVAGKSLTVNGTNVVEQLSNLIGTTNLTALSNFLRSAFAPGTNTTGSGATVKSNAPSLLDPLIKVSDATELVFQAPGEAPILSLRGSDGASETIALIGDTTGDVGIHAYFPCSIYSDSSLYFTSTEHAFYGGEVSFSAAVTARTNRAPFSALTNAIDGNITTNANARSTILLTVSLTNSAATDVSDLQFWVDDDNNGTWDRTNSVQTTGVAALGVRQTMCDELNPSARFVLTNKSTGTGSASIWAQRRYLK